MIDCPIEFISHRMSRFNEEMGRWCWAKAEKIPLENCDFFVCRPARVALTYPFRSYKKYPRFFATTSFNTYISGNTHPMLSNVHLFES